MDGDLVMIRLGDICFRILVCILYLLRTIISGSSGVDCFFDFFSEDTYMIICIFWREFRFSEHVSVPSVDGLF